MLKSQSLKPKADKASPESIIDTLDDAGLLKMRRLIDKRLVIQVDDVNLAEELGLQYRQGKILLASLDTDNEATLTQKAQIFNSVRSMLSDIIKQRKIVYDSERLKRFEAAFMKVLQAMPVEAREMYFDLYGSYLQAEPAEEVAAEE